jgi:hypothetical protein
MIRAAMVGLGRWGRSLVTSVQGKSDDIRFVVAHTRTRAAAARRTCCSCWLWGVASTTASTSGSARICS